MTKQEFITELEKPEHSDIAVLVHGLPVWVRVNKKDYIRIIKINLNDNMDYNIDIDAIPLAITFIKINNK